MNHLEKITEAATRYTREEVVQALEFMNYHTTHANELADWFLLHIRHAYTKGCKQTETQLEALQAENARLSKESTYAFEMASAALDVAKLYQDKVIILLKGTAA